MFAQRPEPTAAQLAKADKLDADAAERRRREQESFDRCDTDGFLSQWAHSIGADKDRKAAQILRDGGCARFPVLTLADTGEVVATVEYKFPDRDRPWLVNRRWRLPDELAAKLGRKWVPTGSKSRVQKQLGLVEDTRWFYAFAELTVPDGAKSTGLAGCANAYVGTFVDEERYRAEGLKIIGRRL